MKLILHIGAGKTGTTAIQTELNSLGETLQREKKLYLGMYFENLPQNIVKPTAGYVEFTRDYYGKQGAFVMNSVSSLTQAVDYAKSLDVSTLIWINESLYESPDKISAVIEGMQGVITSVEIFYYIRRQDHWLKSAYQQWGIKHKTYAGIVKSFKDWLPSVFHKADYNRVLKSWERYFAISDIRVVVYERCRSGVVEDFFGRIGVPVTNVAGEVSNVSPGKYQLSLFKMYNSFFEGGKLPDEMAAFLNRVGLSEALVPDISADIEYPSSEELAQALDLYQNDLLGRYSTADSKVSFEEVAKASSMDGHVNRDSLLAMLLYALVQMEKRINQLEKSK